MTARVLIVPGAMPSRDANGRALPAKLRFFSTGTTTPATVYTDNTLTVAHPFPIASDATGMFPPIWADDADSFDVVWSDQVFDKTIATYSDLSPAQDATSASVALAQGYADQAQAYAASALSAPGIPSATSASTTTIPVSVPSTVVFELDQEGKTFSVGQRVVAASSASALNQMSGIITEFVDPALTVHVDQTNGSGSHSDWVISLTGDGAVKSVAGLAGEVDGDDLKAAISLDLVQNHPVAGRQSLWIAANAMTPRTTNGAAPGLVESTTNKIMGLTLDFDASTKQYAQFGVRMPKAWDLGTVSAVFEWSHASTATNFRVAWAIQAVAISDGDGGDPAFGTAQQANDTGGTTDALYVSPETAAVTVAGSPAAEDLVIFQVYRVADDATNDTLAINARLRGVTLYINTTTGTDA